VESAKRSKVTLFDTSVLVDALAGPRRSNAALMSVLAGGEKLLLCTMVLYEWLRGPRSPAELAVQESLFPSEGALRFEAEDARLAANLYNLVRRARSREADIAIAACAIRNEALLWTLNRADFADIPGIRLYDPKA
jgi:predicted nucleic acid-binding protein